MIAREWKLAQEAAACRVRADQGGAKAQFKLGQVYYYGKGVAQDYAEALRWYRKAADQGDAEAQYAVGYSYSHGQGVPQDYPEALRWYHQAAAQNYARAQAGLATMYYYGKGVPQDYSEAVRWYRKAADQGDVWAEDGLGYAFSHGRGVPQDYGEAAIWYRKAADQGYARAQSSLGYMYYYGRGVQPDHAEAIRWYRKAADQGDEYALRALSVRFTTIREVVLLIQFFAGMWLFVDFLAVNPVIPGKGLKDVHQRIVTGTGLLGVFCATLSWYGYSQHKIRCVNYGFSAFTLCKWLLDAVFVALLVYTMRSGKRSDPQQDGSTSSDSISGSEANTEL